MLSQDGGWVERLNPGLFPPDSSLGCDFLHQAGDLGSVLLRREVSPAGQRIELEGLGHGVLARAELSPRFRAGSAARQASSPLVRLFLMEPATITSVQFRNFKALKDFSVTLREMNILVGPNNSGKSTVLSAFRALSAGLRKANSRNPEQVHALDGIRLGYRIFEDSLPISMDNIHTDDSEADTTVKFRLSNKNELLLYFAADGGCVLVPETTGRRIHNTSSFRSAFPIGVGVVPVLGPVEHQEPIILEDTVRRDLYTHRASRHFRNYWYHNPKGFEEFSVLVNKTWPEMRIFRPSRASNL